MKEQIISIDESIPPAVVFNNKRNIFFHSFIDLYIYFKALQPKLQIIFANIRV